MKKKNFFRGLSTKLVLAAVTLTTGLLTSCQEENLEVKVKPVNAKVQIVPTVVYVNAAGVASDVTSSSTISYTGGNVNSEGIIEGTPNIEATTVNVSASYQGKSAATTVSVAQLSAGNARNYSAFMMITEGNLKAVLVNSKALKPTKVYANEYSHSYNHNGGTWFENASEFFADVKISYTLDFSQKVISQEITEEDATVKAAAENLINAYNITSTKTAEQTFTVSAWALWRAYVSTVPVEDTYNVMYNDNKIGSFVVNRNSYTEVSSEEIAHPSHAGHYHAGHGHDAHGDASNAGGGIIMAD